MFDVIGFHLACGAPAEGEVAREHVCRPSDSQPDCVLLHGSLLAYGWTLASRSLLCHHLPTRTTTPVLRAQVGTIETYSDIP